MAVEHKKRLEAHLYHLREPVVPRVYYGPL